MGASTCAEESDDPPPLLDPGEYAAIYVRHAGTFIFRTMKLRVDLRLLAHPDIILPRWYRVTNYRGGRIQAPQHSDIVREVSIALGQRIRPDRIPVSLLTSRVLRVQVRKVTTDRDQKPLDDVNQYNAIERITGSSDL